MDDVVFSRDVAMLLAQIGPVLVVAFIVEFRALAERASVEGRDLRVLLGIVFGSLGTLLVVCVSVVNGQENLRGTPALWVWGFSVGALALLVWCVALAAWAAVVLTARDAAENRVRTDARDHQLRSPGWKWFLRGRREPLHVVGAVIRRKKDGALLACRRKPGKADAGKWEFPGGKIESGELPTDALIREVREELGIRITIVKPFSSDVTVVGDRAIRLSCYEVKIVGAKPKSSTDHDKLEWVAPGALARLDWSAADLPAVQRIERGE